MISGVLPVDKPAGFTSFDVIAKLRGILGERRLGHSGTLDPMATGVLPVFIGAATKAADILPDQTKSYRAGFVLGFSTDTQDTSGKISERSGLKVAREDIERELGGFLGISMQLPPMYSAVKVGGKRLYDLAREGKTAERTPRKIEISEINLLSFDEKTQSGEISVCCSKGTYIRTLINDLGERLGTFGAMSGLRRTYSQGFDISACFTLDEIQSAKDAGRLNELIMPVEICFSGYPALHLSPEQARMYKNGVRLDPKRVRGCGAEGLYRVFGPEFLGLGQLGEDLRSYKNFWGKTDG